MPSYGLSCILVFGLDQISIVLRELRLVPKVTRRQQQELPSTNTDENVPTRFVDAPNFSPRYGGRSIAVVFHKCISGDGKRLGPHRPPSQEVCTGDHEYHYQDQQPDGHNDCDEYDEKYHEVL